VTGMEVLKTTDLLHKNSGTGFILLRNLAMTLDMSRRLGLKFLGVNKSGIRWEVIITTSGYTYDIP
jgi:hypothetical protein